VEFLVLAAAKKSMLSENLIRDGFSSIGFISCLYDIGNNVGFG